MQGVPCVKCGVEIPVHLIQDGRCPKCGSDLRGSATPISVSRAETAIQKPPPVPQPKRSWGSRPPPVEAQIVTAEQVQGEPLIYCRNCGKKMHANAAACLSCGLPRNAGRNHCWNCGATSHPEAVICVKCGVSLQRQTEVSGAAGSTAKRIAPKNPPVDPVMAAVLSVVLVGLGQIVLGQTIKGVVMLLVAFVLGALTGCAACLITFPVSAIDAYLIAKKLKEGQSVGEWEFF